MYVRCGYKTHQVIVPGTGSITGIREGGGVVRDILKRKSLQLRGFVSHTLHLKHSDERVNIWVKYIERERVDSQ